MSDRSAQARTISRRKPFALLPLNLNCAVPSKATNGELLAGGISFEARAKLSARAM
jgi:hypothetical protein